jgi:hypothetical protein
LWTQGVQQKRQKPLVTLLLLLKVMVLVTLVVVH